MKKMVLAGLMVVLGASAAMAGDRYEACRSALIQSDMMGTAVVNRCNGLSADDSLNKAGKHYDTVKHYGITLNRDAALGKAQKVLGDEVEMKGQCKQLDALSNSLKYSEHVQQIEKLASQFFEADPAGCK